MRIRVATTNTSMPVRCKPCHQVTSEKVVSDAAAGRGTWGSSVKLHPGHRPQCCTLLAGFDCTKLSSLVFPHLNNYLRELRNDQWTIQSHHDSSYIRSIYPKEKCTGWEEIFPWFEEWGLGLLGSWWHYLHGNK